MKYTAFYNITAYVAILNSLLHIPLYIGAALSTVFLWFLPQSVSLHVYLDTYLRVEKQQKNQVREPASPRSAP